MWRRPWGCSSRWKRDRRLSRARDISARLRRRRNCWPCTTKQHRICAIASMHGGDGTWKRAEAQTMNQKPGLLEGFAHWVTVRAGSSWAFALALGIVLIWLITGPIFNYSDTWQLVINTGTTIVTFLMVFLIQRSQNKESLAIQLKLNELVAAVRGASNRLVDVENMTEEELKVIQKYYSKLKEFTKKEESLQQ